MQAGLGTTNVRLSSPKPFQLQVEKPPWAPCPAYLIGVDLVLSVSSTKTHGQPGGAHTGHREAFPDAAAVRTHQAPEPSLVAPVRP